MPSVLICISVMGGFWSSQSAMHQLLRLPWALSLFLDKYKKLLCQYFFLDLDISDLELNHRFKVGLKLLKASYLQNYSTHVEVTKCSSL